MKEIFNLQSSTKTTCLLLVIFIICALFYILKNGKNINFQLKLILIILIFSAVYLMTRRVKEDNKITSLISDFSLTKGKIKLYIVSKGKGYKGQSGNSIKFIYNINKKIIENGYYENNFVPIPNEKPDLNTDYLVIYEKENPENSFILLNYPLNGNNNLEKYKKLFEIKIPDNAIKQD